MIDEEIVARALAEFERATDGRTQHPEYYALQSSAAVAALRKAGRLVPETTRLFYGEPGDSFDQVEERAERSLREWRERIVSVGIHGGDTPVVEIAGPALSTEGFVEIEAARFDRLLALIRAYNGFCTSLYDRVTRDVADEYGDRIDAIDAAWDAIQPSDFAPR